MEELGNEASPQQQGPLKIYFLPFPTPGHMNPMVNLARVFATRGEDVTILTTPSNSNAHLLFPKQLNIHTFDFPSNQVGLPPGLENFSSAKDAETASKLYIATNLLIPQIVTFLQQNPPHVFIPDVMFMYNFTHLEIPILPFNPMPIFVACIFEAIKSHPELLLPSISNNSSDPFTLPGDLPHPITLPVNPSHGFDTLARPLLQAKHNAKQHGMIVNSFAELEQEYIEYYQKLTGVKVWHVGISSLMMEYHDNEIKNKGFKYEDHECLSWLNKREPNSVVYICFGSLCRLDREQYLEIASGIEASGQGFLWVVPEDDEEFCVPEEGLNRGLVVRGWVPQGLILKHPAIGAFLTHCGWNSVAEAICTGVPMITMPRFSDQFVNERLVTEVHGLGVEVGEWEWSLSPYGARNKVVSLEKIENAVRRVMEGGGSSLIRKRAKEMKELACKVVQQGGSSYHNLTTLIESLRQISLDGTSC